MCLHELYFGAFKGTQRERNLVAIKDLRLPVVSFEREDALIAGEIRAHLQQSGMSIGPYDVLIAGQAKARGLVLVTHNVREFSRAAGLVIEDWQGGL